MYVRLGRRWGILALAEASSRTLPFPRHRRPCSALIGSMHTVTRLRDQDSEACEDAERSRALMYEYLQVNTPSGEVSGSRNDCSYHISDSSE